VLSRGDDVVPIPGTRRIRYLEQNVAANEIRLSDADLCRLEERFTHHATAGDRYPDMSRVNIEAPPLNRNSFST
jgi:diketogulonate reductase-like aldo/keto reductase